MEVVKDDLWFCQDCMIAAVNDDYTGLDAYLDPEASAEKMKEIQEGLAKFGPNLVPDFDSEKGTGIRDYSVKTCDCCGTQLHGSRHRFAVLGPSKADLKRRKKLEALVWKHTHKDFKGVCGEHSSWPKGTKTILQHYPAKGTCLVKLSDLTNGQLLDKLPKAVKDKFLEEYP